MANIQYLVHIPYQLTDFTVALPFCPCLALCALASPVLPCLLPTVVASLFSTCTRSTQSTNHMIALSGPVQYVRTDSSAA